jgi:hypothetical protein
MSTLLFFSGAYHCFKKRKTALPEIIRLNEQSNNLKAALFVWHSQKPHRVCRKNDFTYHMLGDFYEQ